MEEEAHPCNCAALVSIGVCGWDTIWTPFTLFPNRKNRRGWEHPVLSAILPPPPFHCSCCTRPVLHLITWSHNQVNVKINEEFEIEVPQNALLFT